MLLSVEQNIVPKKSVEQNTQPLIVSCPHLISILDPALARLGHGVVAPPSNKEYR